ncbi:MAG: hypothetical protein ACFCUT_19070 [Kiloniellaceae bacterium]
MTTESAALASVQLDIAQVMLGRDGVEGFCWPLSLDEVTALRDVFAPALVATIKAARSKGLRGATAAMLLSHHLVMEIMALFQAQLLVERLAGKNVSWPSHSRLWAPLAEGHQPAAAPLIARLRRGPSRRPALLEKIAPLARRLAAGRKASHLHFQSRCPRHGTVSTRFEDSLILRHAALQSQPVTHIHISYWFDVAHSGQGRIDVAVIDGLIAAAEEAFDAMGHHIEPTVRDYLRDFLSEAAVLVEVHLSRLRSGNRVLPEVLWTGSAGNIWDRILRQATREEGGKVSGHDHATGAGHTQNPWKYFLEFVATDCFVTDHISKAEAARRQATPTLLFDDHLPDLQVLPGEVPVYHREVAAGSVRRVMYVSTLYTGEMLHLRPLPADIVKLDWQARLLRHLAEWEFEVVHKPHPESAAAPPEALSRFGRYERQSEIFEKIWNTADLLLFDYPSSSTFGFALLTRKPIVLIDVGRSDWLPMAAKDLRARCAMVQGFVGKDNRFAIEWGELRRAIEIAPTLAHDTSFREHFLDS